MSLYAYTPVRPRIVTRVAMSDWWPHEGAMSDLSGWWVCERRLHASLEFPFTPVRPRRLAL
eukprot:Nk52_evm2s670 gene=Nk52_evmTU2s670